MSEIKLKPCPFCGGEAWTFHIPENNEYETKLHEWIWRTPGRWLVGCDTQLCMLNINNMPETFASEQEAAEAWNKRAELPERKKGKWIRKSATAWSWTCSCCQKDDSYAYSAGESFEPDVLQDLFCPNCGAQMYEEASGCQKSN